MKSNSRSLFMAAVLAAALAGAISARAITATSVQALNTTGDSQGEFQLVAFRDSAEADMLRSAYKTLATGDHDYKGHRIHAMHDLEAAGKLLKMDLSGDLKDKSPQALSDAKLREAQGLINQVLGSAEVKGQKHIEKHLKEAANQLTTALKVR